MSDKLDRRGKNPNSKAIWKTEWMTVILSSFLQCVTYIRRALLDQATGPYSADSCYLIVAHQTALGKIRENMVSVS